MRFVNSGRSVLHLSHLALSGSGTWSSQSALADKALSPKDNQWINDKLQSYREQCTVLFSYFHGIEDQCNEVCVKVEQRRLRNMKFTDLCSEIRDKVHIFGVKPECNMYFGGRT